MSADSVSSSKTNICQNKLIYCIPKSPLEHGWILILKVAIGATGPRVLICFSLVLYCLTVLSLCTGVLSCLGSGSGYRACDIYEQESPFGKAINQSVDMFKATKVDIKLIEPEITYKAGVDVMMMRALI
jgi:hypothetical protein